MLQLLLSKRLVLLTAAALLVLARPAAEAAETDTTPPVMAVPHDITSQLNSPGAIVRMTYSVGVQDDTDAHPRATCTPRSGSRFPVGTTVVRCTATDSSGNTTRDSFRITVRAAGRKHQRVIPAAKRATPHLIARAYRRTDRGVELLGVKVTHVVRGAAVTVTCDPSCPGALAKVNRLVSAGRSVSLVDLFHGVSLRAGTTVRVTTSGEGVNTHTGRIRIRKNRPPLIIR
jgi:hypothetical protein